MKKIKRIAALDMLVFVVFASLVAARYQFLWPVLLFVLLSHIAVMSRKQ